MDNFTYAFDMAKMFSSVLWDIANVVASNKFLFYPAEIGAIIMLFARKSTRQKFETADFLLAVVIIMITSAKVM